MKKLFLGSMLCASLFALSSCDGSDTPSTEGYEIITGNLIVPANGADPYAVKSNYKLVYNLSSGYVTVSTMNLMIGGSPVAFGAEMPYSITMYGNGDIRRFFTDAQIPAGNSTITGFKGNVVSIYNFSPSSGIPGELRHTVNMTYNYGGNKVTVFDINPFFGGTTNTRYENALGEPVSFENKELIYAVNIDLSSKKASVFFYNARFAMEMPLKIRFRIDNLDVEYSEIGYVLSGQNLVPQVAEGNGGQTTPNEEYKFDSFRLVTYGADLNNALIEYSVAGKYYGRCNASQFVIEQ